MNDAAIFAAMQIHAGVAIESGKWASLGAALHDAGVVEAAMLAFEKAVEQTPQEVALWHALAAVRLELKLPQAAWQACEEAFRLDSDDARTIFNCGVVCEAKGDDAGAREFYERALELDDGHYGALCNLPRLCWRLNKPDEAIQTAEAAVAIYPDDAWLHINLGDLLLGRIEAARAVACFSKALALQPDLHYARYALSIALAMQGEIEEAYDARNTALAAAPALATEYVSPLVNDLMQGDNRPTPERVAVQLMFEKMYNCDWSDYTELVQLYVALAQGRRGNPPLDDYEMPYLSHGLPVSEALRQQVARQTAARAIAASRNIPIFLPERPAGKKIRIGYLSANFAPHPNASLMGEIYRRHDRDRFIVHAYSVGPVVESAERERVMRGVDAFYDIYGLSVQAAAQLIATHCIDILIDLSGFTRDARPGILALRPASIQVAYMDFMGTMGASFIDYTLLDRQTLLPEVRKYWDEKIAYLPHSSYHCEMPSLGLPAPSRAELALPATGLVLGALHHPRKLEPMVWACWMSILNELPEAVLWLLHGCEEQKKRLISSAAGHGVARERLVFAPMVGSSEHLARLARADLFLDTFIYNGHTTTIDALGSGVPVVTCSGHSVVSRVAGTMLKAHGLPELATSSIHEYRQLVVMLAKDEFLLAQLRERVSEYENSNLFCPERKCAQIEMAYEMMWVRHQAGLQPEDFDVPEPRTD